MPLYEFARDILGTRYACWCAWYPTRAEAYEAATREGAQIIGEWDDLSVALHETERRYRRRLVVVGVLSAATGWAWGIGLWLVAAYLASLLIAIWQDCARAPWEDSDRASPIRIREILAAEERRRLRSFRAPQARTLPDGDQPERS
jgi:hypothetical protein